MKLKRPRFSRKTVKYKKIYKLFLKSFFCTNHKYNFNKFFKASNSVYGFFSLNFFFFFLNSFFSGELLIDYEDFSWDKLTTIDLYKIKNRMLTFNQSSNDYQIYNNHLPVLTSDFCIKTKFLNSIIDTSNVDLNKFQQLYYISIFESFLNKRIFFRSESNFFKKYSPIKQVEALVRSYGNFDLKILRNLHISELLEIIWYSFQFRDLRLLNNWLKKIMPMLKLKHHKTLINGLRKIMLKSGPLFMSVLKINGFFFKIKGKISVTGNAKKRNSVIRFGSIDLSTKFCKIEYDEGLIDTKVGVLGYKMFMSY